MEAYRVLWLRICVPLGVIGALVALAVTPAVATTLVVVFGALGSLLTTCVVSTYWEQDRRGRLRLLAGGGLVAGTAVGALIGYSFLLGRGVLLLATMVLLGSPYAVRTVGRWLRLLPAPSAAQLDTVARAFAYASPDFAYLREPELRALTDEQVCNRWRTSYRTVQRRQSSAVELIAAVAARQMYLDELERRNRQGFAAWLAASSDASADPLPYLVGDRVEAPAVDWDELTGGPG